MHARKRVAITSGCAVALIAGGVALGSGTGAGTDPTGDGTPAKLDITSVQGSFTTPNIDATVTFAGPLGTQSDTTKIQLDFGTGASCPSDITMYAYRDGGSVTFRYKSGGALKAGSGQSTLSTDKTQMTLHVVLPTPADASPTCFTATTLDDNGAVVDSTAPVALTGGTDPTPTATATATATASVTASPTATPTPKPHAKHKKKKHCTKQQIRKHKKGCKKKG